MPIPDALLIDEIKGAPYYGEYQEHVAKYQQYLDALHGKGEEGDATESPKTTKVTKPKAAKGGLVRKIRKPMSLLKLVDEPCAEDVSVEEPAYNEEEANLQRALELSLKEQAERTHGPACPVVIREPESGRIQPLPDVQGKGKEKVVDEQAAYNLLTLQTPKNKSHVDQFIFQDRTHMPTKASGPAESPSLDAELALTDSEIEFDDVVPKINTEDQDEGQAGPNPESQPQSSHVVHVGPNLEPMDLEATDASPLQNPKQLDEEFTITAYPNVQENLKLPSEDPFFVGKQQEEKPGKTNVEAEVQSMVSVPIHQDTSSVPPMTTPVIYLTTSQSGSPLPTSSAVTSIVIRQQLFYHHHLNHNNPPDLPAVDMEEILQQRMFEDKSYEAHEDHKMLYNALKKSLERDCSDQLLSDLEEARQKKTKRRGVPRTPSGSPPPQPPPPPPPVGASGAPGTSKASGSSYFPPPLPPSTGTFGSTQQHGSKAPSSSKSAASAP
nr:hypothetical protein [Tanacetum cinerariifolium]